MSDDNVIDLPPQPRKRPPGPGRGHKVPMGNGAGIPGWGGPAKGAATTTGDIGDHPLNWKNLTRSDREAHQLANEEMANAAKAKIREHIDSTTESISLAASKLALERVEGLAVQRVVTANLDGDPFNSLMETISANGRPRPGS